MQTKIHLLTAQNPLGKRNGFALMTAVFLMLLISILLLKMLSYTSETAQRSVNEYLNEQAELLTYSATEYALLAISGRERNVSSNCIQTISAVYPNNTTPMFNINISIQYVWSNALTPANGSCQGYIDSAQAATSQLTTDESNGAAVIEVVVASNASLGLDQPIRQYRKSLQKL